MTISDVLQSVHFMVDQSDKPTAAVVDMPAWEAFLQALDDIEDNQLARKRLRAWRSKTGWTTDESEPEAVMDVRRRSATLKN
jgi:hypothetical protein